MEYYPVTIYFNPPGFHFDYKTAALLASVSVHFIHQCEHADLITCQMMIHGRRGLCFADVQKLKLIRHLHEDMGVPLDVLDFLLLYRNRIKAMAREIEEMKRYIQMTERMHKDEILSLSGRSGEETDVDEISR